MSADATSGILRADRVLTLAPGIVGDAIWWEDGRVRAVGDAAHLNRERRRAGSRRLPEYELPGAVVTPGLVDGHTHFGAWALYRRRVQLAGAVKRAEALRRIQRATPVDGWVLGQGWDANGWERAPDRWALDAVQPGPVFLESVDMHAAWLSSAALGAAGITRDTADPFGGVIVRDGNGEPTGLLKERAVDLALPALPLAHPDRVLEALRAAQAEAHRLGVTGLHDVEGEPVLEAFRRLEAEGALTLRVLFHPPVASLPSLVAAGVRSGAGSEWLAWGGIKLFLDGSLGTRTAWMLGPYEGSRDRGLATSTLEAARAATTTAAAAGISSVVHAIGDAAVRRALDLFDNLPRAAIPHRIEHFQCVHPHDVGRAARLGVVLSMQPAHLLTDIPLVERHWGGGPRGRGAYAFRTLLGTGAALVFGSDVPVASIDPRDGIYAALARRSADGSPANGWHPDERLDFAAALHAYTAAPAAAAGVAARRGTLAAGNDADFVAWEVDGAALQRPAPDAADAFRRAKARLTVVGGRIVMRA